MSIELIVRGMCCLRPGVPHVSEGVRVRSVVGRFLEHDRVFYCHAGGKEVVLCSSADWMPRNFFRRVEVSFPIEAKKARKRVVREALEIYLEDNCQAWEMQADGSYERVKTGSHRARSAQRALLEMLARPLGAP